MKDIYFKHDNDGIFTDYSFESSSYLRDFFQVTYTTSEDAIYLGLYKPFNQLYIEMVTGLLSANMTLEYFAPSATALIVHDETKSLSRSGFLTFDKPSNWAMTSVDGVSAYWIKVTLDQDCAPNFKGVNIVYSDDNDLLEESRDIIDYLASGDNSFIAYHVSSRNDIIQTLRNSGKIKTVDYKPEQLTKWDVLELGEIRQASKYLTLSKIFFDISENVDDKMFQRYESYKSMYGKAFDLFRISIDNNDDGIADDDEKLALTYTEILKQ